MIAAVFARLLVVVGVVIASLGAAYFIHTLMERQPSLVCLETTSGEQVCVIGGAP